MKMRSEGSEGESLGEARWVSASDPGEGSLKQVITALLLAGLFMAPSQVRAQEEEEFIPVEEGAEVGDDGDEPLPPLSDDGEAVEMNRPVKVAAFVFPDLEMDANVATEVVAGLRRGIRADKRLELVDPSNALAAMEEEEESEASNGISLLERAIEEAGTGRWRNVVRTLDDAIEIFEGDLANTPRRALVDATMLWGAAQCQLRRRLVCQSAFRRVVTFRENVTYDEEILPPRSRSVFEEVRDETLSGARGSLRIETEPPGAEVYVDGRFVGAAPTRAEGLLAGDHYVTLKMVGYRRQVQRVTVQTDFEDTASFELIQMENAPLLRDALTSARQEMGQTRIGGGMRDLWSLLLIDQVILGDLSRVGNSDEFDLTLFVYDLRTSHGLRRLQRRIQWEAGSLSTVEQLTAELYRDVDLSGRIRPTEEPTPEPPRQPDPFYRTWWFWSIIGAVVVGTTIGVASTVNPDQLPEGIGAMAAPF
jgi:hypothetical protein